jgi:hypothetical protein
LKENIQSFTDGLSILKQINPVSYELNGLAGTPKGAKGIGLIAQDVKDFLPYTVKTFKAKLNPTDTSETELYSLDSSALEYVTINALKELDLKVESVSGEVVRMREMGEIREREATSEVFPSPSANSSTSEVKNIVAELLEVVGKLIVSAQAEFKGSAVFQALVEFRDKVIFHKEVELVAGAKFSPDTAGIALIPEMADRVEVKFEKEFEFLPVVTISQVASGSAQTKEATASGYLAENYQAAVWDISTKGFSIVLDRFSEKDLYFNWIALNVGQPRLWRGDDSVKRAVEALTGKEASVAASNAAAAGEAGSSAEVSAAGEASQSAELAP